MKRHILLALACGAFASAAHADAFNRVASFPVAANLPDWADSETETAPEIIAAVGETLFYTDGLLEALGFIDISNPLAPSAAGVLPLAGEPTSVAAIEGTAIVGLDTSSRYGIAAGVLLAVDVAAREIIAACDIGGQPDAVAIAPDGSFVAVAVENERDEGINDGEIPQLPAGNVTLFDLTENGLPDCGTRRVADLTGLADIAPSDPEPEYIAINGQGDLVVTLQENNHLVVLSQEGEVLNHFSAGAVDLRNVDTSDDGALIFTDTLKGVAREPDAVTWIDGAHFATANEGDYDGGSRGWSIFHRDGSLVWDSEASFEHAIAQIGHYPDKRSDAKGIEPESIAFAVVDGTPMVFVGAEWASIVGVYDVTDPASPALLQLLPSGVGPEGLLVMPERGLFVTANEGDLVDDGGTRAHVMIYQWQDAPASYPHLTSAGMATLTGWGALSGLVADGDLIRAVSDDVYSDQPRIFTIDPRQTPALIIDVIDITRDGRPAEGLDAEGIALDGRGGFWIASEGNPDRQIAHALYRVDAAGEIVEEVPLPPELLVEERRFGTEGVALLDDVLWVAMQREWKDDPEGLVKLLRYDPGTGDWSAVHYPLQPAEIGWVGLSDIAARDGALFLIERDTGIGETARIKLITRVRLEGVTPAPLGSDLPVVGKDILRDLLPDLRSTGGFALSKVEGLAIRSDGRAFIVTDNDGVDDHSGETLFLEVPLR